MPLGTNVTNSLTWNFGASACCNYNISYINIFDILGGDGPLTPAKYAHAKGVV